VSAPWSCNPLALARDSPLLLPQLSEHLYEILRVSLLQLRLGSDLAGREGTPGASPVRACRMENDPRPLDQPVPRMLQCCQPTWNLKAVSP
jgi:hypothetical protein